MIYNAVMFLIRAILEVLLVLGITIVFIIGTVINRILGIIGEIVKWFTKN